MGPAGSGRNNLRNALIRAITFDIGGTLIHPAPSVGHIYANVAADQGYPGIVAEELNHRFAAAWARLKDFSHTYTQWAALVDETFAGLIKAPPSETFFPELYQKFAEPDAWAVLPDVVPTLKELAEGGLKLGVISNWDERLRPLLGALGLDVYFQAIVVSCETGCCKPAPAIFGAAAEALHTAAEQILHVGDSPEMDLLGARAAGMQAVLIRRPGGPQASQKNDAVPGGSEVLPSISALTDLPGLVPRL